MNFTGIIQELLIYKYLYLLPVAIVEGPIISVIGGFLTSLGYLNFFLTYLVLVVGDLIGDCLYYGLGYWGRVGLINRWGHRVGINSERVVALERHFEKNAGKTLVIGKLTQVAGGATLVAAGASKMKFWKFFAISVAATLPKSLILMLIGFYFGNAYVQINNYIGYAELFAAAMIILFFLLYFLVIKKYLRRLEE